MNHISSRRRRTGIMAAVVVAMSALLFATALPATAQPADSTTPSGFLCSILGVDKGQDVDVDGTFTNTPPSGSSAVTITNP